MSAEPGRKIEELESIRGLAAILVVLFHMPIWNALLHDIRFIQKSYYMVDMFFVLSGFVMNLNYGERLRDMHDLAQFQFLRLGRLFPVHILFLILAALMAAFSWIAVQTYGLIMPNGSVFKDVTVASFVEQLLLIHSLGFFTILHPLNLPSWSISVEFYTYLIFGIICLIPQHVLRLSTFATLACVSLALLACDAESIGSYSNILQCFAGYFLGCLLASFSVRRTQALPRGSTMAALVAMVLFLCTGKSRQFDISIFFLSALLIMPIVCGRDDFAKRLLRHKSLKFLGMISYSIYMSHTLVLWVCNQFVRLVLRRPEAIADGISTPQLSLVGAFGMNVIALFGTILVSAIVFNYVEDPFRLRSKELARRFIGSR